MHAFEPAACLLSVMFLVPSPRFFRISIQSSFLNHKMQSVRRLCSIRLHLCTPTKQVRQIYLSRMSSKPVRALIMGPPGSGKGTVSEKIVNTFSVTHLSSGDVLRSQIKEGSEVGLKAKDIVEKGGLVPDEIMIELILNKMKELGEGSWLLDGEWEKKFCRRFFQTRSLVRRSASYTKMVANGKKSLRCFIAIPAKEYKCLI